MTTPPLPIEVIKTMYEAMKADPRSAAFGNEAWFVAGATMAEAFLRDGQDAMAYLNNITGGTK